MSRKSHTVVHLSHEDAATYAAWSEKRFPTELEMEFAASQAFDVSKIPAKANTRCGNFPHVSQQKMNRHSPFLHVTAQDMQGSEKP